MLIAALLELKSRLMLPGEEVEELDELAPAEAAEELIERMLLYARFRAAGTHLRRAARARARVPVTAARRCKLGAGRRHRGRLRAGRARRGARLLLRMPKPIDLSHMAMPRVTVAERLTHLRGLLRASPFSFDEAVKDADRVTVCVTVFALLELYKRGEAAWEQDEPFGEITVHTAGAKPVAAA